MTKVENLYAEVVVNESPFFYDENGRLRVHVLEEQKRFIQSMDLRSDPKTGKKGPSVLLPVVDDEDPEEKKLRDEFDEKNKDNMWAMDMPIDPDTGKPTSRRELAYKKFKQEKKAGAQNPPASKPADDKPSAPMPPSDAVKNRFRGGQETSKDALAKDERRMRKPTLRGLRKVIAKRIEKRGPVSAPSGRNVNVRPSRPSNMTLAERLDLKKADMGTVIKDFQKSDAPQFKGKSKTKRREMAIAAKLQAERGTK